MKIAIKNESIVLLEHFFVSAPIFLSVIMRFPHCCTAGAAVGQCTLAQYTSKVSVLHRKYWTIS